MRAQLSTARKTTISVIGAWLFIGAATISMAEPVLTIEDDPAGQKISWDAVEGRDHVLQGSDDGVTWAKVELSILQPGGTGPSYALVPTLKARKFYRLFKDDLVTQSAYVGPQRCSGCHSDNYNQWRDGGHPHKLNKVVDGQPPAYFSTDQVNVPNPPQGVSWDDVSYVIGGAIWKARFIGKDGYIITGTQDDQDLVQYNLQTGGWVTYHRDEHKPYDCGRCHTTGWVAAEVPDGPDGGIHQEAMDGMWGSFSDSAISCEACHGPASRHVTAPFAEKKNEIIVDRSAEMCGNCHNRGGVNDTIPASGGFIRHHEQYNEMASSGHGPNGAAHTCVTCHDPHKSVKVGAKDGIHTDCVDCHNATSPAAGTIAHNFAANGHAGEATCVDCHMPRASKTAVAVNKYTGDIQTHIFKINTAADGEMFSPDGKTANGSAGVTLGYVCYQCHVDGDGIGGGVATELELSDLGAEAENYHNIP
jgi:hypothetical protein